MELFSTTRFHKYGVKIDEVYSSNSAEPAQQAQQQAKPQAKPQQTPSPQAKKPAPAPQQKPAQPKAQKPQAKPATQTSPNPAQVNKMAQATAGDVEEFDYSDFEN